MGTVSDLPLKSLGIQRPGGIMWDHLLFFTFACESSETIILCVLINLETYTRLGYTKEFFDTHITATVI